MLTATVCMSSALCMERSVHTAETAPLHGRLSIRPCWWLVVQKVGHYSKRDEFTLPIVQTQTRPCAFFRTKMPPYITSLTLASCWRLIIFRLEGMYDGSNEEDSWSSLCDFFNRQASTRASSKESPWPMLLYSSIINFSALNLKICVTSISVASVSIRTVQVSCPS